MIYFLSDAHLGSLAIERGWAHQKKLINMLEMMSKDAVSIYMLGDMFDFWFEYYIHDPKKRQFHPLMKEIRSLIRRGIHVHYFIGNHDLWTFGGLAKMTGMEIHFEPCTISRYGKSLYLCHGDGVLPSNWETLYPRQVKKKIQSFIRLKELFNSPTAQFFFRLLPPAWGNKLGYNWAKKSRLNEISRLVEGYSGIAVAPNQPIVGDNVFTQVAGVHADGDSKNNLYSNDLIPERFGRRREYALGKNSGRANIAKNLEELGLELTPEQTRRVTERITELGDKKELVTQDDLPYIVSDVLKHNAPEDKVKLVSYMVSTSYGLKPLASIKVEINGQQYEADSTGDGQYDAFVKALRLIYKNYLGRTFPLLDNYSVSIPPGGRTDALVQTIITWRNGDKLLRTRGLDADQTEAAIKATFKMLNIFESGE